MIILRMYRYLNFYSLSLNIPISFLVIMLHEIKTVISTSVPKTYPSCPGMRRIREMTSAVKSSKIEIKARSISITLESILLMLIEIPTNINPVNAADAPADAI